MKITDIITSIKIAQTSSFINHAERYMQIMSITDLDVIKELVLTSIKKY